MSLNCPNPVPYFCLFFPPFKQYFTVGRSPGLVVMGGDSCAKGCVFESRHRILDGHFSHLFVVKIVICVWKEENKWKRGRGWPIFLKKQYFTEDKLYLWKEHQLPSHSQSRFSFLFSFNIKFCLRGFSWKNHFIIMD